MGLLLGVAALGCFLLLVRGYTMMRTQPEYDLGASMADESRPRTSLVAKFYDVIGRWAGPLISGVLGPSQRAQLNRLLVSAGHPRGYDLAGFLRLEGAYATLSAAAIAFGLVQGSLLIMALGLMLIAYPVVWLWSEAQKRQQQIDRELPDFLDILAITVTAGLGFRQALARVGETVSGPLGEEMSYTLHRMDLGIRRRQAFTELRERNPASVTMGLFVTAILQAEELGAPLADTLNQLADDMRREYSQQSRRRAARAAPRVSLIITMIIMPALIGLIVLSLIIGSDFSFGQLG